MIHELHKKRVDELVNRYLGIRPTQSIHLKDELTKLLQDVDDLARFEIRPELTDHRKDYANFDKAVNALRRLFETPPNDVVASYSFAEVVKAVEDDYKEWEEYVSKK